MLEGFENHPYAPRSTADTRHPRAHERKRIPAGTEATPCRFCQRPVYLLLVEEAHTDEMGRDHGEVWEIIDAETDVAGVLPTATEIGSGIGHGLLCGIPRPLPLETPASFATSTSNATVGNTNKGQPRRAK